MSALTDGSRLESRGLPWAVARRTYSFQQPETRALPHGITTRASSRPRLVQSSIAASGSTYISTHVRPLGKSEVLGRNIEEV